MTREVRVRQRPFGLEHDLPEDTASHCLAQQAHPPFQKVLYAQETVQLAVWETVMGS